MDLYYSSPRELSDAIGGVLVLECKICRIKVLRALKAMLRMLYFTIQAKIKWEKELNPMLSHLRC